MNIDIVFPVLPPSLDGIGDHTARLARALAAQGCSVRVLTAQEEWTPHSGVTVQRAFHLQRRHGILDLINVYRSTPHPDWLLLQFEQFSYGRWGLNPFLPFTINRIKRYIPETNVALMVHEHFVSLSNWKFVIMSLWQRPQFSHLGREADAIFVSTQPWLKKFESRFPCTPLYHLPVGSNIPYSNAQGTSVRRNLGLASDAFVVGVFGSTHHSRLLTYIRAAVDKIMAATRRSVTVLYIGPNGPTMKKHMGGNIDLLDTGPLPAEDVSKCFSAMDLYLAPFESGVSTRRGSFLTGIQHGVATVSTTGPDTGQLLTNHSGTSFVLTPASDCKEFVGQCARLAQDSNLRKQVGSSGKVFFDAQFSWRQIATSALKYLQQETSST